MRPLSLGGDNILWEYHTHTFAVLPLQIEALALFLSGHTFFAFALLGIAFNLHAQSSTFLFMMCFGGFVASGGFRKVGALTSIVSIFVFLALPTVIWILSSGESTLSDTYMEQVSLRSGHHVSPLTWSINRYVEVALACAFSIVGWSLARRSEPQNLVHMKAAGAFVVVLILCIVGLVFSEWIPVMRVMQAQPFRSTKFLNLLFILYITWAIVELSRSGPKQRLVGIFVYISMFLQYLRLTFPLTILGVTCRNAI